MISPRLRRGSRTHPATPGAVRKLTPLLLSAGADLHRTALPCLQAWPKCPALCLPIPPLRISAFLNTAPTTHADQAAGASTRKVRKEHQSWRCHRIPLITADSTIPTPTLSSLSLKIFSLTSSPGYAGDAFWLHTIYGHHLNQKHYMLRLGAASEAKSNRVMVGASEANLKWGYM